MNPEDHPCFAKVHFLAENYIYSQVSFRLGKYAKQMRLLCCLPIDIEEVVEVFEQIPLTFAGEEKLGSGVLGHYNFYEDEIVISDAIDHEGRRRFTIAHEYGHFVLHRPHYQSYYQQPSLGFDEEPREKLRFVQRAGANQWSQIEVQANLFASECLMPFDLVLEFIQRRQSVGDRPSELAASLAKEAQVSQQAAQIRLDRLMGKISRS